ncbi:MAG: creatininase family protein [Cyclobacteriaceae bacterium]|nr:creatininase family protein [Cyclobacteriaceae bacterium]
MRPYILAESNWKYIKDASFEVAVLPWGACEAHNYHLPYATDIIESEHIAAEAGRLAWEQGAKVIVLPAIPFGVNTGQFDVKLNINMNPSTQLAVLRDVLDVLNRQDIHKLIILNSHGGNDFKSMIRELGLQFPNMFLTTCNWFQAIDQKQFFEHKDDHAGEMETSLLLYLRPDLVLPLAEASDGAAKKFRFTAIREGWAWAERKWTQVTASTGVGDPRKATREKGERYFKVVTEKVAKFFMEVAKTKPGDFYM